MNTLRQSIAEYLALRRSLGFKMNDAARALPDFATFMGRRRAAYITQALALRWAQIPSTHNPRTGPAGFATCASSPATEAQVIRARRFRRSACCHSSLRARPYLYTDEEIEQLLHATLHMPLSPQQRNTCALLPWVYYCLFGLLSVSGLRLGEVRNLKLEDVDLRAGVLTVRGGKFGKDRWVPIHPTTCKVLSRYIERRKRHWGARSVSPYLFVSSWGNRLDGAQVHRAFYAASRRIGLRGARDSHGPRLHDLRHRFATTTLVNWYRSKEDPERRLPFLSAFLGHVHVADTQWYLSGSPELMREAMRRLEHRWGSSA